MQEEEREWTRLGMQPDAEAMRNSASNARAHRYHARRTREHSDNARAI